MLADVGVTFEGVQEKSFFFLVFAQTAGALHHVDRIMGTESCGSEECFFAVARRDPLGGTLRAIVGVCH